MWESAPFEVRLLPTATATIKADAVAVESG